MEKYRSWLIISLLIFLSCFLLCGYYNRFASDDFEFLNKLRKYGVLGSVEWFHSHWNTRWSAIGLLNCSLLLTINAGTLLWYHLVSIILLWYAFYRNTRNLIHQEQSMNIIFAGYTALAFFYSCFSISDVFFWINTSTMYLFGCIAFLFAVAEITTRKHTVPSYIRLALFGLFIAGAYEPLVFTTMLGCLVVLVFLVYKNGWKIWSIPFDKKIIILLSSLMIGFAISFSGDGHVVRSGYLPQTDLYYKIYALAKAVVKMFAIYLPGLILPVLLFSFPWFVYGANRGFVWLTPRMLKIISGGFIILVVISLGPVAFIMSEMGPERAWTQITLWLVIYASALACYAGAALKRRYNVNNVLRIYAAIALIYILATGVPEVFVAFKYSKAYDERVKLVLQQSSAGRTQLLELKPLPYAGWLHSAELSEDSTHFNNVFLKEFLNLKFTPVQSKP